MSDHPHGQHRGRKNTVVKAVVMAVDRRSNFSPAADWLALAFLGRGGWNALSHAYFPSPLSLMPGTRP